MTLSGQVCDRRDVLVGLATAAIALPARVAVAAISGQAAELAAIERKHGGRLGVFVLDTGSGRTLAHRAEERFLMCSSFKGLLAACVLARIDAGMDRLDAMIHYGRSDLLPSSPVIEAHVDVGALSVAALCGAILTRSDNAAANLLLARIGGPAALTSFARRLGDRTTRFDRTEPDLNTVSGLLDTTTPAAIVSTVRTIYLGRVLKPATLTVLERGMIANVRGPKRLRATLPRSWTVGDRTGTSVNYCNDFAFARRPHAAPVVMAAYYEAPGQTMEAQEAALREVGTRIADWAM